MASEELLNKRYEITATIAESPSTATYRARDHQTGRECAIKRLAFKRLESWKGLELFEREAKVLAHLDHPRIPRLLDFFRIETDEGLELYSVREYVEGLDLSQVIESGRRFTEKDVLRIGLEIAKLLEYLHGFSPPILHRDIKPRNILLTPQGEAHLIDFGSVSAAHLTTFERGSTVAGTFGYMPVEQFAGRPVPASDIYSLGATMVYLLTHKDPADMSGADGSLDLSHFPVSKPMAKVLRRMVRADVTRRHASASRLREDLEDLIAGGPRRRMARIVSGAALVGVVAGAGLGFRARFNDSTAVLREAPEPTSVTSPAAISAVQRPPRPTAVQPWGPVTPVALTSAVYTATHRDTSVVKAENVMARLAKREGRYTDRETYVQVPARDPLDAARPPGRGTSYLSEEMALDFSLPGKPAADQNVFLEIDAACGRRSSIQGEVSNRFGDWDYLPGVVVPCEEKWEEVKKVIVLGRPWSDSFHVRLFAPSGDIRFDAVRAYLARSAPASGAPDPAPSVEPSSERTGTPIPLAAARFTDAPPGFAVVDEASLVRRLSRRESDFANPEVYVDFPVRKDSIMPTDARLELTFSVPAAEGAAPGAREVFLDVSLACWRERYLMFEAFNRFEEWDRLGRGTVMCEGDRWEERAARLSIGKPFGPTLKVRISGSGKLDSVVAYLR